MGWIKLSLMLWFISAATISIPRSIKNSIGDGRVSDSSNADFFLEMDSDKDGMVERHEIREVLVEYGGVHLDEQEEIDRSLEGIFDRVDSNNDSTLSHKDLISFWHITGAALTVNETADWVIHSVQLPEEVGKKFREERVTGIDFADLLANDGAALRDVVGIEKVAYRRKLQRAIKMMMTGVGTAPSRPTPFMAEVVSCSVVSLEWAKAAARQFQVHKYRVLRRFRHVYGAKHTEWELIYEGPESRCFDTFVVPGMQYEYTVGAWNLFGRSEAEFATVSALPVTSCPIERGMSAAAINSIFGSIIFRSISSLFWMMLIVLQFSIRYGHGLGCYKIAVKKLFRLLSIVPSISIPTSPTSSSYRGDTPFSFDKLVGTQKMSALQPQEVLALEKLQSIRRENSGLKRKENSCAICDKEFKPWKLHRHYCGICEISFCAHCGDTKHPWFKSCAAFGGKCRCKTCCTTMCQPLSKRGASPCIRPKLPPLIIPKPPLLKSSSRGSLFRRHLSNERWQSR